MRRLLKRQGVCMVVGVCAAASGACHSKLNAESVHRRLPAVSADLSELLLSVPSTTADLAVTIEWNDIGAKTYTASAYEGPNCEGQAVFENSVSATSVAMEGLDDGLYSVCLRATMTDERIVMAANNGAALEVDRTPPTTAALETVTTSTPGTIELRWPADADVESYLASIADDQACEPIRAPVTLTRGATSVRFDDLEPGRTYVVCLEALDHVGNSTLTKYSVKAAEATESEPAVVESPTFGLLPGRYTSATAVSIDAEGGAVVHYTVDSSSPSCASSPVASGPINVTTTTTIKAVACDGETASAIAQGRYVIVPGQWFSQKIATSSDAFVRIEQVSDGASYALSQYGDVLKSTDGAIIWNPIRSPGNQMWYDMACPAENTCYVTGWNGLVARTVDGGGSWSVLTSPGAEDLWGIRCVDAMTCVVVGNDHIYRTADGGSSWTNWQHILMPFMIVLSINGLDVDCVDANTCVAIGAAIYQSVDGGATWAADTGTLAGNVATKVDCLPSGICYIVGYNSGDYSAMVFKSVDSGATWADITALLPAGTSYLQDVHCFDAQTCLAAFEATDAKLAMTADGGATWSIMDTGIAGGQITLSCREDCVLANPYGDWVRSHDQGQTWTTLATAPEPGYQMNGLACPDAQTCYLVGANGLVEKSTNGGESWSVLDGGSTSLLDDIHCIDTLTCIAVGAGGEIIRSIDGGGSWAQIASGTAADLTAVTCPKPSVCLATGIGGVIVKSTNRGASWTSLASGVVDDIDDLSCSSPAICYATAGGNVLRTSDAGASWTQVATGVGSEIGCAAPDYCMARAPGKKVVAITDGVASAPFDTGLTTWTEGGMTRVSGAAKIHCFGRDECFVVGVHGHWARTDDGGATWATGYAGLGPGQVGAQCIDPSTCWIFNNRGLIRKTTSGGE